MAELTAVWVCNCSPCPRLYIAVSVMIKTLTVRGGSNLSSVRDIAD